MNKRKRLSVFSIALLTAGLVCFGGNQPARAAEDEVVIGLNYPETGPYVKMGLDQRRGADLAMEEINRAGGILGKKVKLVYKDSKSNPKISKQNAIDLFEPFDGQPAQMIFGGVSSDVAIAVGKVAKAKKKLFFGTSTYSTETTGEEAHKYIFRQCYDSRMAAKVLSDYLKKNFKGKKYFYITADYSDGWTTEDAFRKFTDTTDKEKHRGYLTRLGQDDFKNVLTLAQEAEAEVLVLVLLGRDMEIAVKQAYEMGLKKKMQIVVPNMTIDMAEGAGPEAMEGILSTTDWYWKIPFDENYPKGMEFVKKFEEKYKRYPSTSGASAYVILHQYKEAVERVKSFGTLPIIDALENYKYTGVKDEQQWRDWDHQSLQTVYAIKLKKPEEVKKDKYHLDYYEIIAKMKGEDGAINYNDWCAVRTAVDASLDLE